MTRAHLLVTNDFPPKIGGIQSYLFELWSRLPPESFGVLTTTHDGAAAFDAALDLRIERVAESFLVPTPGLVTKIDEQASAIGADLVLLDPAWPLGAIGPMLDHPYGVVLHGAEVTIPARLPFVQLMLRHTLRHAQVAIAAGTYPDLEGRRAAGRAIPSVVVPPGVDATRFTPADSDRRRAAREQFGIEPEAEVALCVSRLVPRKGADVAIQACARLAEDFPRLRLVVAGDGRDRGRLEQLAAAMHAPVSFVGGVADESLPDLYAAADFFVMLCRDRWFGLEQEGFGIVFLEAAASGLASIAGASGGAADAVVDGVTGLVVDEPHDVDAAEDAIGRLLDDPALRARFGAAGRARVVEQFGYGALAATLGRGLDAVLADLDAARVPTDATAATTMVPPDAPFPAATGDASGATTAGAMAGVAADNAAIDAPRDDA